MTERKKDPKKTQFGGPVAIREHRRTPAAARKGGSRKAGSRKSSSRKGSRKK
jgi:hypothetical protein